MARKRSLSTTLFASPDFFELSSNTVRLIFIGIILDADDEGRGLAHARLLARKLDQKPEEIEQALEELAARGMLCCYEVASRRFYWLCHWQAYQTLSKPTPSHYPAPPEQESENQDEQRSEATPSASWESHKEDAAEQKRPSTTTQVAAALHLPESDELREIAQEFISVSSSSILGEAIEARAWIDDRRRNTRQQPMTLAFFRRWLRRSQRNEEMPANVPARGKDGAPGTGPSSAHVPDQYEIYVKALQAKYSDPAALQAVG